MAAGDTDKLLGSPLAGVRVAVVPVDTPPQHLAHAMAEQQAFQPPAASPDAWPAYEALSDAATAAAPEGELIIAGTQVARGYTGPSAASSSKFGEMPAHALAPGSEGRRGREDSLLHAATERWVRTGDIVQRRPEGLVFVGRVDRQLKLEGVRCNLAEIEGVLRACALVREAVVVLCKAEDKVAQGVSHHVAPSARAKEGGAQRKDQQIAQSKHELVAAVHLEAEAGSLEHLDADRRLALHLALELHCKRLLPGRAPCSPRPGRTPTHPAHLAHPSLLPRFSLAPCLRARRLAATQA
jgi:acyl-CoA synthetase (AMP-forming)/AMP-acid ligase II